MEEFDIGFGLYEDSSDEASDTDTNPEKSAVTKRNIYKPLSGGTKLHRAIKSGVKSKIEDILKVYLEDFEKVKNYLVSKYQWNPDDKIWLKKIILVAASPDQCELVKGLEKNAIPDHNLQQAIIILLLNPVDGESVAVIHPNESNKLEVFRVLCSLIPNGFLSWNYTRSSDKQETFVETAASCGNNDIITRLLDLGAELGPPHHNPLVAACHSSRKDTIRWLLDKHFDDFDCTMMDEYRRDPFIVLLQKKNIEMLDFVLLKMLSYRQKYFGESKSEAFNDIFHHEYEEWPHLSCLTYVGTGPIKDKVAEYIVRFKLDLSYESKEVNILGELLQNKMAMEYCYSEIRKNPKLLKMAMYGNGSVLHECIRLRLLDFLNEMYESNPEIKKVYETERGFTQLQMALWHGQHDAVRFILDNHKDFLTENLDKLKSDVIFCWWHAANFYENNTELLSEYFPDLKQDMEEAKNRIPDSDPISDLQQVFKNITFGESSVELDDPQQSLSSIRGINGETLLHYAVDKSDQELFTKILEAGCVFDTLDNDGNHPVHYVQCVEMFNFLVDNHPEGQSLVHRKNSTGLTVLHKVCGLYGDQKNIVDLVERIIECGADVNLLTDDGDSVVHKTVSIQVLDLLLKHSVNLAVVNKEGNTAFQHHLEHRNTRIAGPLLALVHKLPSFKEHAYKCLEPFMYSHYDFFNREYQGFLEENPETTKLIFDSVYNHSREEAERLFTKACASAHNFIADKFLEFDYDLDYNYKDDNGSNAMVGLLSYVEKDNTHIVKRLLQKKGVDLEIRNRWGQNALLSLVEARWCGHNEEIVQLLLDHGAQINSSDNDGNMALHLAFVNNEYKLVELLVRNGAHLSAKNKAGKIPVALGSSLNEKIFYFMT